MHRFEIKLTFNDQYDVEDSLFNVVIAKSLPLEMARELADVLNKYADHLSMSGYFQDFVQ